MLRFHIANMTCGGCAKAVEASLRQGEAHPRNPPAIQFDLARREVSIDAQEADAARISARLIQDGWEAMRRPG